MDKRTMGALLLAFALAATLLIYAIVTKSDAEALITSYGYLGIALVMFLSSATVILPAPGLAVVFAAGRFLNPVLVGLFAGTGAALGELTGYFMGYGGRQALDGNDNARKIQGWVERYGFFAILVLAAIPNPVFDIVGIAAGGLRYDIRKFLLAALMGNVIKATYIALLGEATFGWLF